MRICLFITSGHGPAECTQAVAGVLRLMVQEAEACGLHVDRVVTPAKHGLKSAVLTVEGTSATRFAAAWRGTIQWRSDSTLRRDHKRANWFIGVFEIAAGTAGTSELDPSDVRFESFRAGGPGGQHQNTTDSAVRAVHLPSGAVVVAREERSQHRNKALALSRLRDLLGARAAAEEADRKSAQNGLHKQLERGNPVRCFKGPKFVEQKGQRND